MTFPPIIITLTGAPKGKGRPRFSKASGRAFTPAATRTYEDVLRFTAQEIMGDRAPIEGPLSVAVIAQMPIPASWSRRKRAQALAHEILPTGKPDVDNIFKMLDALNEVVWKDDSQIVDGSCRKVYSDRPMLVVEIRPYQPPFM